MTSIAIDGAAIPERPEPQGPVWFTLRRWPVLWLSLRIALLTIVTLGFYRFWGKTRLRQTFWRHVSIAGDPLEYTGRPVELLLGFLAAIVILIPVFAIPSVTGLITADPRIVGAVNVLQFLVIFYLVPVALFRARRYLLTRTLWRGIAFGQDGSAFRYANLVLRWSLLVAVTLGVAYPRMRAARQRYLVEHSWYGGARFAFNIDAGKLTGAWLAALGCIWGAVISIPLGRALIAAFAVAVPLEGKAVLVLVGVAVLVTLGCWAAFWVFYIRYRVREFRLFTTGTSLGAVGFDSALPARPVLLLYMAFFGLLLLTVGIFFAIAVAGSFAMYDGRVLTPGATTLIMAAALLPASWAYFVLNVAWLRVGLLRIACQTLTIHNLAAVEGVIRDSGAQAPRYGEGMADALDVGAF